MPQTREFMSVDRTAATGPVRLALTSASGLDTAFPSTATAFHVNVRFNAVQLD